MLVNCLFTGTWIRLNSYQQQPRKDEWETSDLDVSDGSISSDMNPFDIVLKENNSINIPKMEWKNVTQ